MFILPGITCSLILLSQIQASLLFLKKPQNIPNDMCVLSLHSNPHLHQKDI